MCSFLQSLEGEIKDEMSHKEVLSGLGGALGGYLIAKQMNYGTIGSIVSISGGHFIGHFIGHKYF